MQSLSVVIVCKNEESVIGRTLQSLHGVTDDIVVYDTGSTDKTIDIVRRSGAVLHLGAWEGFGKTKQKSVAQAKYDWVLSLDADEIVDPVLKQSLLEQPLTDERMVYAIKRKNFFNTRHVKYGEWGSDWQNRLFNRRIVNWDDAEVHEKLFLPGGVQVKKMKGNLLHKTVKDIPDYTQKTVLYASLSAEKYFRKGKKATWWKIRLAPGFTFIRFYFIQLGFLDGFIGYTCAKMAAWYTFLKYIRLKELRQNL